MYKTLLKSSYNLRGKEKKKKIQSSSKGVTEAKRQECIHPVMMGFAKRWYKREHKTSVQNRTDQGTQPDNPCAYIVDAGSE